MRGVLCLFSCLLLGACGAFTSKAPLFSETRGECPFTEPTAYAEWKPDEYGRLEAGDNVVFASQGGYCVVPQEEDDGRALFVPLRRDIWIVQLEGEWLHYLIAQREGHQLEFYLPDCADFDSEMLAAAGVIYAPHKAITEESESITATEVDAGATPSIPATSARGASCIATRSEGLENLFRVWWGRRRKPDTVFRRVPTDP